MRPKIFLVILLIFECFLLVELAVPAGQLSLGRAVSVYHKWPNEQNKRNLENIKAQQHSRYQLIAYSAGANLIVMVLYAWKRKL